MTAKSSKVGKKTILLLRQGKAEKDDQHGKGSPLTRALSDDGKRNAQRMGVWLAAHDLAPDEIVSSSAERAIVSAEKCIKSMGIGVQDLRIDHRLYQADPKRFIKLLSRLSEHTRCVLIVGDKTGLESLLRHLLPNEGNQCAENRLLKASSLAVLTCNVSWSALHESAARLDQCVHAASLPRQFPYPDAGGDERRDRPSYYYRQSAVVPYRMKHKRIEILLITSSSNKHWGVPKGIQEPGMSARDSAAKEALEEAGIEGMVGHNPLGCYAYEKWGSACQVEIFPMRVGHVANKKQWQESHRQRQWYSVKKARALLHQQALLPMIDTLVKTVAAK